MRTGPGIARHHRRAWIETVFGFFRGHQTPRIARHHRRAWIETPSEIIEAFSGDASPAITGGRGLKHRSMAL